MNNKGDLISREALKKKLQARHDNGEEDFDKGYNIGIEAAIELLDNAPTVDIPTKLCKGCRFLKDCETCEEKLRPQGEWIITEEEQGALGMIYKTRKCNKCGWEHSLVIPNNFCPHCGADMRGDTE